MSRFSGKCDLFDHICGQGGWYDRNGKPVKFGQEGVGAYYSDELQDFLAFKQRTGGVLHQHKQVKLTPYNQDEVAAYCPDLEIIKHVTQVADARSKTGYKEKITYTYKYWGKEYTLKELNKKGIWVTIDIHFNTILDLIPYYPYIVSFCFSDKGKETVVITDESYVISERDSHIEHGYFSNYWEHYSAELQKHYLDVCQEYLLYNIDERTTTVSISNPQPYNDEYYVIYVDHNVDMMHDIKYIWSDNKNHSHWTSPTLLKDNMILLHKSDIEGYLKEDIKKNTVQIQYIKECKNINIK